MPTENSIQQLSARCNIVTFRYLLKPQVSSSLNVADFKGIRPG